MRRALAPTEQAFNIIQLQLDVRWPAVVALAGSGRPFHLAQQSVHLGNRQTPPRAYRPMAGHRRAHRLQPFLQQLRIALFQQLADEIANQATDIGFAEQRGDFAHGDGINPELFNRQPKLGKLVGSLHQQGNLITAECHDLRNQQTLPGDVSTGHLRFHPLVDQTLVRGVLIHDDNGVLGLGNDVIFVHLCAHGTERLFAPCRRLRLIRHRFNTTARLSERFERGLRSLRQSARNLRRWRRTIGRCGTLVARWRARLPGTRERSRHIDRRAPSRIGGAVTGLFQGIA